MIYLMKTNRQATYAEEYTFLFDESSQYWIIETSATLNESTLTKPKL